MNLVICVDNLYGYSFNNRLQSRDRAQKRHFNKLKREYPDKEWLVIENQEFTMLRDSIDDISLYRWNRLYPADKWLNETWLQEEFVLKAKRRLKGFSHETITYEYYVRRKT